MEANLAAPRARESRLSPMARTELFLGRVVVGTAAGEAVGLATDKLDPDLFHHHGLGANAVAAVGLGLIYAIKNLHNPR